MVYIICNDEGRQFSDYLESFRRDAAAVRTLLDFHRKYTVLASRGRGSRGRVGLVPRSRDLQRLNRAEFG